MTNFHKKKAFLDSFNSRIEDIPDSNGCRFYKKLDYKIAIIADEFFYNSIKDAANFIYLTKDNWAEVLNQGVDAFFFETAWSGIKNEWCGFAWQETTESKLIFDDIIAVCNRKKIPTIFFSKEDPPDFYTFLPYAKKTDYVFSSAVECVNDYKKHCQHNNVYATSFCFNPQYNNPIGLDARNQENQVLFAGAWYESFPERCLEQAAIFDSILKSSKPLVVIDRQFTSESKSQFPSKYWPNIYPGVAHNVLQKLHKIFKWAINLNSVKDSETMFANRTCELLANGTLLISNYSIGVNHLMPSIFLVNENTSVEKILDDYSERELYERQMAGVRSVMSTETCYHRIAEYLAPLGLNVKQPERKILVITNKTTAEVKENFSRQTFNQKTLIESSQVTEDILSQYDMVTWFGESAYYGEFYLEDMVNAFKYTACDYVTKDSWYEGKELHDGIEHNYVDTMKSKERTVFWVDAFDKNSLLNMSNSSSLPNGYSIDNLEYDAKPGVESHREQKNFELSVIIPVHNNGQRLYLKAFPSLRLCSMFNNMEIIIVDDGSTDNTTIKIEDWLAKRYNNIKIYRFSDQGSGNAARPRNMGVEMATAPYVMYLDPDDEVLPTGIDALLKKANEGNFSAVIGSRYVCNHLQCADLHVKNIEEITKQNQFEQGLLEFFEPLNFPAIGLPCILHKKSLYEKYSLKQAEGVIGEDTLFSLELLSLPERMSILDIPVYVYHERVPTSQTNFINKNFFERTQLVLPHEKAFLEKNNLWNTFTSKRVESFILYLLSKLSRCVEADREIAAKKTWEIIKHYEPWYKPNDYKIKRFINFCRSGEFLLAYDSIRNAFEIKIKNFGIRNFSSTAPVAVDYEEKFKEVLDKSYLLQNERQIRFKYGLYKVMSKLCTGSRRTHYIVKKARYKDMIDQIRKFKKYTLTKV